MWESGERLQVVRDGNLAPLQQEPPIASVASLWRGFHFETHSMSDATLYRPDQVSWPWMHVMLFTRGRFVLSRRVGFRAHSHVILPRSVFLHPGGFEVTRVRASGHFKSIVVQIDGPLVSQIIPGQDSLNVDAIARQDDIHDETVAALIRAMHAEVLAGCPAGALYAESLSLALAGYIASRFSTKTSNTSDYHGCLSKHQFERVIEFTLTGLGNELSLRDLASVAQLSPRHFARLFKNTLGVTPHQYVVQERVRQAKRLLAEGRSEVGEIALLLGFGSQSHFTKVFRNVTGITPKRYQRDC